MAKIKPTPRQLAASKKKINVMVASVVADNTDHTDSCERLRQLQEAVNQTLIDLNCPVVR